MESNSVDGQSILTVRVSSFTVKNGVVFYLIIVQKLHNKDQHTVQKRYSQFHSLNESLKQAGYIDLPKLPPKTLLPVRSNDGIDKRRAELNQYLRELARRRETRNSREVVRFLELEAFVPDILYQKPALVQRMDIKGNYFVTQCMFHAKHNLFLIALNEKNGKDSRIEIHSFKCRSITQDSYNLPHGELDLLPERRCNSFSGCVNPNSSIMVPTSEKEEFKEGLSPSLNKTEKIIDYQFTVPIKRINFCINVRLLVVGFVNGVVEGYEASVEYEEGVESDEEEEEDLKMKEYKKNRVHGTVIMTKAFEQVDDENRPHRRNRKEDGAKNSHKGEAEVLKMVQYFSSYMRLQVHKDKLNDMVVDQQSCLVYTCGEDRRIKTVSLMDQEVVNTFKTVNAVFVSLQLDKDLKKLFGGTRACQLFIFSIEDLVPIVVHSINLASQGINSGHLRALDLDQNKNLLLGLTKEGELICIQLDTKQEKKSTIIECVSSNPALKKTNRFAWMTRMGSSLEGHEKGLLTVNDLEQDDPTKGGRCLFQLQADFNDKVTCIHYNREKNVFFAGSRDNKFRVWKVPKEWRHKDIDILERDYQFQLKTKQL